MRYVSTRLKQKAEEMAYRIYVTDGIKVFLDDFSQDFGGKSLSERYYDLITKGAKPEETRTEDEIISDITSGLAKLRKEDSEEE